ncbi:MAG: acetyltransferase [Deltaproteobacteria bacterium]|nr:acetyltransferase [Deltaproteobacteria bacterium]
MPTGSIHFRVTCGQRPEAQSIAQAHLERFYGEFGFVRAGEPYDDGIPHIEMLRA